jgi:hypothetical protein
VAHSLHYLILSMIRSRIPSLVTIDIRVQQKKESHNMNNKFNQLKAMAISMLVLVTASTCVNAQGRPSDPLASLKRSITLAGAPALSTTQETALNSLITEFKNAQPDEADEVLETAREAYDAAIIAGDLSAAQVQITIITTRTAQIQDGRMQEQAKFGIAVLAVLKSGGQYDLLVTKFGSDRVLSLVLQLAVRGGRGPEGPGEGRR